MQVDNLRLQNSVSILNTSSGQIHCHSVVPARSYVCDEMINCEVLFTHLLLSESVSRQYVRLMSKVMAS